MLRSVFVCGVLRVDAGNSYGIADGLMYSFPVTCAGGKYTIVKDLSIGKFSEEKMKATEAELLEEKTMSFGILGK
jgi:hypothetical protein